MPPAKVLVIGAGVAGLAAIGTATSLGAITLAFDVRPEVAEQIESMGAEFVYLDFEEAQQDGAATGGYAAPSSPEFREKQLEKFRALAPEVDIVITTALIPGRDGYDHGTHFLRYFTVMDNENPNNVNNANFPFTFRVMSCSWSKEDSTQALSTFSSQLRYGVADDGRGVITNIKRY